MQGPCHMAGILFRAELVKTGGGQGVVFMMSRA